MHTHSLRHTYTRMQTRTYTQFSRELCSLLIDSPPLMDSHEYICGRCTAAVAEEAEWHYWQLEG